MGNPEEGTLKEPSQLPVWLFSPQLQGKKERTNTLEETLTLEEEKAEKAKGGGAPITSSLSQSVENPPLDLRDVTGLHRIDATACDSNEEVSLDLNSCDATLQAPHFHPVGRHPCLRRIAQLVPCQAQQHQHTHWRWLPAPHSRRSP